MKFLEEQPMSQERPMSQFKPTVEQEAITEAAVTTNDNLLVSALAGAAKTSTLVMIAEALPKKQLLCLAFNKKIAVEMEKRLPMNCQAMTLNSLGHRVWGQTLGKRLIVDTKKNYNIVKQLIGELPRSEKDQAYEDMSFILKAVEFGKTMGYVPDGKFENARALMRNHDLYNALDEEPGDVAWRIIREASFVSMKQAWQGMIDFSDQILMPGVFPVAFPSDQDVTLVDETQDLSVLNHVVLKKLVKSKRIMAVGDDCQSIYAFRGAHPGSMDLLRNDFSMRELLLSVSFRCPSNIVQEARWRAPHMQWFKEGGQVNHLDGWSTDDLPDRTTIVCRNNAPLFGMAFRLLKAGRYPELVGNDIGKNLVKTLTKFGPPSMTRAQLDKAIDQWLTVKLTKVRNEAAAYDQAECLRIFAEQGETLADAIAYAEHILAHRGPVTLMTIHKSKGLEYSDVMILDQHLIRTGDQQEDNLRYVAQTRTKDKLTYVNTEGWG